MNLSLNLIFLCVTSRMSIMGGVGIEDKFEENQEKTHNKVTEIYENIQNIISKNNLKYDKFFMNDTKYTNTNASIHDKHFGSKPIPIPKPYK